MDAPAADLARIRRAFEPPPPEPKERDADRAVYAVLLPLFDTSEGPALLYTRRAESLRHHPGEMSFPGGRVDPQDDGPLAAALREAQEEVGIEPARVDLMGHLTDFRTFQGTLICSYVGHVQDDVPTGPASPDEVSDLMLVPVRDLLDPKRYEARRLDGMPEGRQVHYWRLDPWTVWGITGEITARFLARTCGWSPPVPARTVADVGGFRPERRKTQPD